MLTVIQILKSNHLVIIITCLLNTNYLSYPDSSITDEAKYSSVVRVKPSHCQFDSSHIGAVASSNHSTNEKDHKEDHSEPVVYAKVNRHHTTEKATNIEKATAVKTEGNY